MPNGSVDISSEAAPRIATPRRRLRRFWHHSRAVLMPLLVMVVLGVVWEAAVRFFEIPEFLLPAPSAIYQETINANIGKHIQATFTTVMLGFLVSVAISMPLAILVTSSQSIANAVYPLLVLTQSVPKVALAPILVVTLGAGELSRVTVTFLVAFFPLVISVAAGLMSVPRELLELSRSLKATRLQELWRIRLPYAIPFVFSGLKLAITFAVVGATVGEFVAADAGLGYQIISATAFFRTSLAFGALIILSFLGIALFQAVVVVERVFFPWSNREEVVG